jgi:hypothetical protein
MVKKRIRDIERMVIDIVAVYVLDRLCRTLTKYTHVDKQVYSTIGNILIINKYIQALTKQRTYS